MVGSESLGRFRTRFEKVGNTCHWCAWERKRDEKRDREHHALGIGGKNNEAGKS